MAFRQPTYDEFVRYFAENLSTQFNVPFGDIFKDVPGGKARSYDSVYEWAKHTIDARQLRAVNKMYEAEHGPQGRRALKAFPIATTIIDV